MKFLKSITVGCLALLFVTCQEDEILKETPLDFITIDNSYITSEGINSAIVKLYERSGDYVNIETSGGNIDAEFWLGTDVCYHARDFIGDPWTVYEINPDYIRVQADWEDAFKIVFDANVIINRAAANAENPIPSGNTETIWAFQNEYPTPGGDLNAQWERVYGPEYNRYQAKGDNVGVSTFVYESTYKGGRAQGYIRPTSHVTHGIWAGNFDTDIRNSENNVLRKWWVDNPQSVYYNDTINTNDPADIAKYMGGPRGIETDTNRYLYPTFLKFTRINNHEPEELEDGSLSDAQRALATPEHIEFIESFGGVGPKMAGSARRYRADIYALRMAETYLLRAEAYLNTGNTSAAADDINEVRNRSNGTPVLPGEVDIDYILDERLRELLWEEPRRITLGRLGLIYDRTSRYNDYAKDNIQEFHNLYPVPLSEIQANVDADLGQNPGY